MHVPDKFREQTPRVMCDLMKTHPLGTWIIHHNDELIVNHIPFVVQQEKGDEIALHGHINRANPVWKKLSEDHTTVIVFHGPQSYISPAFYPSKREHGKVVPTWNYLVVHAHGKIRITHDGAWLMQHLNALTNQQEAVRDEPWQVADAPEEYTRRMLNDIVGIQIKVHDLQGMWKTSQNKSTLDQRGVVQGLQQQADSNSMAIAASVLRHNERETNESTE